MPGFAQISTWHLKQTNKDSSGVFEHDGKIEACETVLLLDFINGIFYLLSLWLVQKF